MTAEALLPLMMLDNELIITHGNGPVVGKILMRQMLTRDTIAPMPLDICVAHSQGIAYLLMQAMENALQETNATLRVYHAGPSTRTTLLSRTPANPLALFSMKKKPKKLAPN